jgi:hypothetical protein
MARLMIADSASDYVDKVLRITKLTTLSSVSTPAGPGSAREVILGQYEEMNSSNRYEDLHSSFYDIKRELCQRRKRLFGSAVLQAAVDEWRDFLIHSAVSS